MPLPGVDRRSCSSDKRLPTHVPPPPSCSTAQAPAASAPRAFRGDRAPIPLRLRRPPRIAQLRSKRAWHRAGAAACRRLQQHVLGDAAAQNVPQHVAAERVHGASYLAQVGLRKRAEDGGCVLARADERCLLQAALRVGDRQQPPWQPALERQGELEDLAGGTGSGSITYGCRLYCIGCRLYYIRSQGYITYGHRYHPALPEGYITYASSKTWSSLLGRTPGRPCWSSSWEVVRPMKTGTAPCWTACT